MSERGFRSRTSPAPFKMVTLSLSNYIIPKLPAFVKLFLRLNSVIGKGIEPHPTDGHTQNNLSNDIETHGASIVSTPVMP